MKKKNVQQQQREKKDQGTSLGDLLDSKLAEQLKQLKQDREAEIQKQREEEAAKKQWETKQKEKNKTFDELLNESKLDWKKFK